MTYTEKADLKDRALLDSIDEELSEAGLKIRHYLAERRAERLKAQERRNYALMELDHNEKRNARWQRRQAHAHRALLVDLKGDVLEWVDVYAGLLVDRASVRKSIARRASPEYRKPRHLVNGRMLSTQEIVDEMPVGGEA